ncbi:MAG: Holliday junction resolvase RuvX [Candidatus Magasanikbacteria bacterium]
MNILAIDFGTKNIGLAWCDTGIGVVLPYGVIRNKEQGVRSKELSDLIIKERIEKVVIGLPMGLDGKENTNTTRVKKFGGELAAQISIPVDYCDERFSSQQADRSVGGASRDEKSAMVILESYLQSKS